MDKVSIAERDKRRARRRSRHRPARRLASNYTVPLDRYPLNFQSSGYVPHRIAIWRIAWLTGSLLMLAVIMTALAKTGNTTEAQFIEFHLLSFAADSLRTALGLIGVLVFMAIIGTPLALLTWMIESSAEHAMRPRKSLWREKLRHQPFNQLYPFSMIDA